MKRHQANQVLVLDPKGHSCQGCEKPARYVTTCDDGQKPLALCRSCATLLRRGPADPAAQTLMTKLFGWPG